MTARVAGVRDLLPGTPTSTSDLMYKQVSMLNTAKSDKPQTASASRSSSMNVDAISDQTNEHAMSRQLHSQEADAASALTTLSQHIVAASAAASPAHVNGNNSSSNHSNSNTPTGSHPAGGKMTSKTTPANTPRGEDSNNYRIKRIRNNEAVRRCRIKKKQEMEEKAMRLELLEHKVSDLENCNRKLSELIVEQQKEIQRLRSERDTLPFVSPGHVLGGPTDI
ncbi:uncharacterized protein MONBRDRAFT_31590 [Monosiga brevicollis MX1]|uniref:BZIP domain-containing protein n=1 Tax=Monosiga brevicollis TaxID=81824 RepID=A9UU72_MONBE|nr:uncharacterized protein MONBRDRAFT_31590 [Monosiga brevicollis MX1]EDQ91372.1 predicted protein [Monosiga brevicollis MX1]|eukprot:XP_001743794.1 hypothetical protein [Monosiga brevicollis MX1]